MMTATYLVLATHYCHVESSFRKHLASTHNLRQIEPGRARLYLPKHTAVIVY